MNTLKFLKYVKIMLDMSNDIISGGLAGMTIELDSLLEDGMTSPLAT